jgi:(2R)-3-sulfolactate dehydrogenase (NADP+)
MNLSALDAIDYATELLVASGVEPINSRISARAIVVSDLWKNGGHGLMRLPFYLQRIAEGGINPAAKLISISQAPSVATFDGEAGLGHWQLWNGALHGAEMASTNGISLVTIRNSNHCGALGIYVYPALDRNLLSIIVSTGPAVMPAFGGRTPILSTSPIAAGIPAAPIPIVIDMATSAVARGKIAAAAKKGESIPQGWAFDQEGNPTTDAQIALMGMLAPLGGAKGFAMALLVESLSAGLAGGDTAVDVPDMFKPEDDSKPQAISHSVITIDPAKVAGEESFAGFSKIAQNVLASGGRIPGAGRVNPSRIRYEEITIAESVASELEHWARDLGVAAR